MNPVTNPPSLKALEWGSVCSLLVKRAARVANREAFAALLPGAATREEVTASLGQVELLRILLDDGPLRFAGIPEVLSLCDVLGIRGEYLDGADLVALARFAVSASRPRPRRSGAPRSPLSSRVALPGGGRRPHPPRRRSPSSGRWRGPSDPKGEVRDDASPELRRLRARTHRLREDLDLVFETYLRKPNADDVLQDKVVASRNGRSVLMVKAEAKRSVRGCRSRRLPRAEDRVHRADRGGGGQQRTGGGLRGGTGGNPPDPETPLRRSPRGPLRLETGGVDSRRLGRAPRARPGWPTILAEGRRYFPKTVRSVIVRGRASPAHGPGPRRPGSRSERPRARASGSRDHRRSEDPGHRRAQHRRQDGGAQDGGPALPHGPKRSSHPGRGRHGRAFLRFDLRGDR